MLKLFLFFILLIPSLTSAKELPATYFKVTQSFIDKMVKKHNFNKDELTAIFYSIKLKTADKNIKNKQKKIKRIKRSSPIFWNKFLRPLGLRLVYHQRTY